MNGFELTFNSSFIDYHLSIINTQMEGFKLYDPLSFIVQLSIVDLVNYLKINRNQYNHLY